MNSNSHRLIDKKAFEEYHDNEKQKTLLIYKVILALIFIVNIVFIAFVITYNVEISSLKNDISAISEDIIKQNEIAKNHFKDFFKYINLEGQAYSSLISSRDELKQKYMVELSKLNAKKEKLLSTGDTSKFELNPDDRTIDHERLHRDKQYAMENMCFKEGNDLKILYNQLGYYNKMNIHELKKMIRKYVGKFVKNLEGFDEEFYPTINDVSY